MLFIGGIATVLFLLTFMCGYFKIPTNQAGIVSGLSKTPKIIIGKAGFKFPFWKDWTSFIWGSVQ